MWPAWVPCARSQVHLKKFQMYVYHCKLPQFQVIEIEALSIRANCYHQSCINVKKKIWFCEENHVFTGEEFESKWRLYKFPRLKPICFSEYLKQFLELWNTLKPFRMWKHFWNPLEMVWILFENPLLNVEEKIFSYFAFTIHMLENVWQHYM